MFEIQVRITESGRSLSLGAFVDAVVTEIVRGLSSEIHQMAKSQTHPATTGAPLQSTEEKHRRVLALAVGVNEAAKMLGVSSATIRRHIAQQRLRAVRVGSRVLVPMEVLQKVILEGVVRH